MTTRESLKPFTPDYAIPPGETLRERLSALAMSQAELAARTGYTPKHINQVVQGVAPLSYETAVVLERVTGVPARVWNSLEANYRAHQARLSTKPTEADLAWARTFPLKELKQRGIVGSAGDERTLVEALLSFFGVRDRSAWERLWLKPVGSFRRSKAFESNPAAMTSWLRLGELQALTIKTAPYEAATFRRALDEIRRITVAPDFGERLMEVCAVAGVAVVYVRELPKCRVSGAARWLAASKPVIQLSDRHKHDDFFWFSFFHEAAHILLHSKKETFIDDGSDDDMVEAEANRFAETALIPESVEDELADLRTLDDVRRFAARIDIAPGIVIGRLHHQYGDPHWGWGKGNQLRRRIQIVDD